MINHSNCIDLMYAMSFCVVASIYILCDDSRLGACKVEALFPLYNV